MVFRITRRRSRASGFTLVEVMLVVFLITLTALIFAATIPTSQISRIKAAHYTYAVNMARQTIEEKQAAGYASLLPGSTVSIPAELPGAEQTTNVTQYSDNLKKVEVTITWSGYRQVGGNVSLVTLISDRG